LKKLESEVVRGDIVKTGKRIDGRDLSTITSCTIRLCSGRLSFLSFLLPELPMDTHALLFQFA
jgi:hypothetical protein